MLLKKKTDNKGFTLIELLVVISIIGLLSSIALASLNVARIKARDVTRISDFHQLQLSLALYYDSYGVYPCGNAPLECTVVGANCDPFWDDGTFGTSHSEGFLESLDPGDLWCTEFGPPDGIGAFYPDEAANDPSGDTDEAYLAGQSYFYYANQNRQHYLLGTRLENNDAYMENDGGYCDNFYEEGTVLGQYGLHTYFPNHPNAPTGCNQ